MPVSSSRPMILIGTFNKMLQYTGGIFADLHCQLHRSLGRVKRLIVSGYGFGDKGINTYVAEWITAVPDRRIIVVDPNCETLKNSCRGAIRNKWEALEKNGRLKSIPKEIEETSWDEIKDGLLDE